MFGIAFAMLAGQASAGCDTDPDTRLTLTAGGETLTELNAADLDGLPQQQFVTSTQWTEGQMNFSGPSLSDVLTYLNVEIRDRRVTLVAANRYTVDLDPDLLKETSPIVATHINGCRFGLTDLGPLWVVFPYDASPDYQSEAVYAASIWHFVEIRLGP